MDERDYEFGRRRGPIVAGHPEREPRSRPVGGGYGDSRYGNDVPRYGSQFGYGDRFDQGYAVIVFSVIVQTLTLPRLVKQYVGLSSGGTDGGTSG
ncbi:hypothetical protein ABID16_003380 [Rhizobium aquaticum]|uniref:Uncharacterized protein n=1 Tax=Rhizobium aquaticum TaxID=1549636 RepID=A0ABV2J2N2_9HYPH